MSEPKILIPADGLRLPDAVTVKHGDGPMLARFMLKADKFARDRGVRLRLRNNWDELLHLNRSEIAKGNWYPLAPPFDPERTELTPESSFWLQGQNDQGETVLTCGFRIYDWRHTNLENEIRLQFYGGRDHGQECEVTTPKAREVSGWVGYGGMIWVRPDYRRLALSTLPPRIMHSYALATWPMDWSFGMVRADQVEKGICAAYGFTDVTWSVKFPNSPLGDLDLGLMRKDRAAIYSDIGAFEAAPSASVSAVA